MESLSAGEIRVIHTNLLWLVEGFDENGWAICRHKTVEDPEDGWSKATYKFTCKSILDATDHYWYLITDLENE